MVRRRGPKKGPKAGPRPVDRKDGKMKRWNTAEDIPMDEEEEFHANKDRILLDGGEYQGDDDGDEEEVFALKGIPASDSDEEDEGQYEDEDDMEDVDMEEPAPAKSPKKSKAKAKARAKAEISESEEEEEEEEEESWGRSKAAYYSSNAAELESDDEETNELEEQEARRLQAKARDVMTEDDFGLGDVAAVVDQEDIIEDPIEPPPKVDTRPLPTDRKSIIRHLEKTSPETIALAADWEDIALKLVSSQERLKQLEANEPDALSRGMVHLHYQTLLTYATTLAFYLHLRTSDKYAARPEQLRAHPIFGRLLQLKQALSTLEELDFDLSASDAGALSDEDADEPAFLDGAEFRSFKLNGKRAQLDFEDLAQLLREAEEDLPAGLPTPTKKKSKSKTPDAAPPPKKRKLAAPAPAPPPIFDLAEPAFVPSAPSKRTARSTDADAFGDAQTLGAADAADKSARKKSLRFHTAQIAGTSARRAGARAALGGDDDVPYRERRREQEARRLREAAARGLGLGGADLDATEPEQARKRAREDDAESGSGSGEEDEGGYYSLVKQSKTARKAAKQAEYDAAKAAARPDVGDDSAAGPRSLTRAILKNRGLTPHRAKSVRNPRVKKRQKFDKAKKVLASQKAVYKGPGDATRYAGEQSGISKVVKSVRF